MINGSFLIEVITNIVKMIATPPTFYILEKFGWQRILIIRATCMVLFQYLNATIEVAAPNALLKKGRAGENKLAVSAELVFMSQRCHHHM